MPTIGIVSSIPYETTFKTALENNVNVSGVTFLQPNTFNPPTDNVGDDKTKLGNAVKAVITAGANFIVTLGGVNPYNAAADTTNYNPNTPFFSLIGETPPNPLPTYCRGGVSLESWKNNEYCVQYLISKRYNTKGAISLYYNQNSGMTKHEVDDWTNNLYGKYLTPQNENILVQTPVKAMKVGGPNNANDFATTVKNIKSTAVIASAAPFFHNKHSQLVGALNNHKVNNVYVYTCYHLKNYTAANPSPRKNYSTVYTQTIEDGITTLAGVITLGINSGNKQVFKQQDIGSPQDIMSWWRRWFG